MLRFGSLHRKLPIVVDPSGDFYTPTTPRGYNYGNAIADCMLGSKRCSLQRLSVQKVFFPGERSFIPLRRFRRADRWVAQVSLVEFDSFPKDWRILAARSYRLPNALTPKQAVSVLKAHVSSKPDAGLHHYAEDCPCESPKDRKGRKRG